MLKPKKTLVFIKHSEPLLDPSLPPNRWRLSEKGRHRSVALAGQLEEYGPEVIVTSEELKARETGRIVADRLGAECFAFPQLHEHDRTGVPFLGTEEFERAARSLFENPEDQVWGNETAEEARLRFDGAVRKLLGRFEESKLAVVAHGTVIALFLARYNDLDAYEFWHELGLPSFCVLSSEFRLRNVVRQVRA